MQLYGLYLIGGGIGLFFVWLILWVIKTTKSKLSRNQVWSSAAEQLESPYVAPWGWREVPLIVRRFHGYKAQVEPGSNPDGPYTQVVYQLQQQPPFQIRLHPQHAQSHQAIAAFALTSVSSGSSEFDRRYLIKGRENRIRRFLTADCRQIIDDIHGYGPNAQDIGIFTTYSTFIIRLSGSFHDAFGLKEFAQRADSIFHAYLLAADLEVRVEFIEIETHLDEGHCLVCGTDLNVGGPTAVCSSCDTPHHVDCWLFIGRCSTFGCGCNKHKRIAVPSQ